MPPEVKAGDFGARLRQARERRGVGLREIANDTKISIAALEALERNDVSKLPGGIFSRAFVRSYAAKIGLDPEETVDEFLRQFPHDSVTVGHASSTRDDPEAFESDRRMASVVLTLLGISVPLAGLVIYFGSGAGRLATPVEETAAAPVASAPASAAPASARAVRIELTAVRDVTVWITADDQAPVPIILAAGGSRTFEVDRELVLNLSDASAIAWSVDGIAGRPIGADGEAATLRLTPENYRELLDTP